MTERMDVVTTREYTTRDGETKTAWTRIGTAWATRNGGWRVSLEALPVASFNAERKTVETSFLLMPPKDKPASGGAPASDDDIPFKAW